MNWLYLGENSGIEQLLVMKFKLSFILLNMSSTIPFKSDITKKIPAHTPA